MEPKARLIHKTQITFLPTKLPVNFYGLPNGKVYVIYSRFYEINFERSGLEYVFAEHEEFSYNFEINKLVAKDISGVDRIIDNEHVDKPDPKFKIIKVYRSINSYKEAENYLGNIIDKYEYEPL